MPFLPQEIIRAKRDGRELAGSDIERFVAGLTDGSIGDDQVAAFAMAVYFRGMTVAERVALTAAMAHSGSVMHWDRTELPGPVLDKHSTGGVGDKVSLMLAPLVAACGGVVHPRLHRNAVAGAVPQRRPRSRVCGDRPNWGPRSSGPSALFDP